MSSRHHRDLNHNPTGSLIKVEVFWYVNVFNEIVRSHKCDTIFRRVYLGPAIHLVHILIKIEFEFISWCNIRCNISWVMVNIRIYLIFICLFAFPRFSLSKNNIFTRSRRNLLAPVRPYPAESVRFPAQRWRDHLARHFKMKWLPLDIHIDFLLFTLKKSILNSRFANKICICNMFVYRFRIENHSCIQSCPRVR